MNIKPKEGVLLIRKHTKTKLTADMVVEETDDDKRLITGEIISTYNENDKTRVGQTIIFGKYALYQLTVEGVDYFFIEEEDVIGICDYKEDEG